MPACADRVDDAAEVRPSNNSYNSTPGTNPHDGRPRVDGNFTGTTDEILQWAACKWGIDEDIVRAQAVTESYWFQTAGGDLTNNQEDCHPDLRTTTGPCPESIGVLQVRYGPHEDAFEDANAIYSTAYNVDYAYAIWRACYEGEFTWLNDVEHGATYRRRRRARLPRRLVRRALPDRPCAAVHEQRPRSPRRPYVGDRVVPRGSTSGVNRPYVAVGQPANRVG